MDKRAFKDQLFRQLADIAKAFAHPRRMELLELVAQTERTVEWLTEATGMTVANTSQHLQVLRHARLVESRKQGLYVFYRAAGPEVVGMLASVRAVAERRDAELERLTRNFFASRDTLEAVSIPELLERIRSGDVIVLDVRPPEEFASGHIAGARSVPIDQLQALAADLPHDQPIVAYCRGPYCVFADEAVHHLRALGFDASRLEVGFPEWWAAGHPIEGARA